MTPSYDPLGSYVFATLVAFGLYAFGMFGLGAALLAIVLVFILVTETTQG